MLRGWWPLLLLGCGSPTDPASVDGCVASNAPSLEVGKGEAEFVDAAADDERTILIHGFQGGYHSFVSARASGLAVDGPWDMEIVGFLGEEERVRVPVRRDASCNAGVSRGEILGTWLIWGIRPDQLGELHQQRVRIALSATDVRGREAEGSAEMVLWSEFEWE